MEIKSFNKRKVEAGTNISLIPIENDDNFYSIHHEISPSNRKISSLLKRSYDFNKVNLFEENSLNFRKMKLPKLNLKLYQEHKLPSLITRIPHSGHRNEKLIKHDKINSKKKCLTINNIVFDENNSFKKKSKDELIFMKRFIKLRKKNLINRNSINNKYEKDLNEFKIYSHNMNEMIAEQMVREFFRRFNKLQSINFNDLLLNYIKSCDGKNNIINENASKNNINTTEENKEKINDEKIEHNLIIHNVFFEWIITKVIRKYTNYLKTHTKALSVKNIKNILINEVKYLSKLFFHKKFEKINKVRNAYFIDLKFDNSESSHEELNSENSFEIKKMRIKNELIDNIIDKVENNESNSYFILKRNKFNNYPKSVTINNKRNRDIQINLKKNTNFEKDMKNIMNNTPPDILYQKETENNEDNYAQLINYQSNIEKLPLNIRKSISKKLNDIQQKTEKMNTEPTLIEKYRGSKQLVEEEFHDPKKILFEQYYKYEGIDQQSDDKEVINKKNRNSIKLSKYLENFSRNNNDSELLKYDKVNQNTIKNTENNNTNNINNNNINIRSKTESNNNNEFNGMKNQDIKDKILFENMKNNYNNKQMNKNNEITIEEKENFNKIQKNKENKNEIENDIKKVQSSNTNKNINNQNQILYLYTKINKINIY